MPKLTYKAIDFNPHWGPSLKGEHTIDCNWSNIIWASITVGKKKLYDVFKRKGYSTLEAIFRVTMIFATLKVNPINNRVIRTEIYNSLDPSEKNAISYFQGLMTAKLLSKKLLDTEWLMHLDVYDHLHIPTMAAGSKSRPDFIGLNSKFKWIIIESKGRSNSFDPSAQIKAKKQTRKLRKIDCQFPILRAAVQSYFTNSGYFKSRIDDPEEYDYDAIDIEINQNTYLNRYYKPILDILSENSFDLKNISVNNTTYITTTIPEVDLILGLNKTIYDLLLHGEISFDLKRTLLAETLTMEKTDINTFIGGDGILVITGEKWNVENMILEPTERK